MPLVDFQNVSISPSKGTEILSQVNFTIGPGEFAYIIGQVGSGKTSLLRTIDGELKPKGETAQALGFDLKHLKQSQVPELRRRLGIVFQDFKLLRDRTVEDNLQFVLRATGWKDKEARRERIAEVMTQVGLHDKLPKFPHELSGGEQQRVAIARAILNSPELILADEPTGNLDPENVEKIMNILFSLKQKGTAVIMVTHNQHIIDAHPATTYLCQDGTLTNLNAQNA
ncbi:MAG: ATP-binding cassette domain-containing protein [Bacteroidaceae bacterium]|nr:ATP-binding cassette domain-containing protein [Bacteroidaceae bacterium]